MIVGNSYTMLIRPASASRPPISSFNSVEHGPVQVSMLGHSRGLQDEDCYSDGNR